MTRKKKIILAVLALLVVVLAGIATIVIISSLNSSTQKNAEQKPSPVAFKKKMDAGYKLEEAGNTKEALKHYKEAGEFCKKDDIACNTSADSKIQMMQAILEYEAKNPEKTQVKPKEEDKR